MIEETGLSFRAHRHTFVAAGPDGWSYGIYPEWHRVWEGLPKKERYAIKRWRAFAGGAIHYTVDLGTWPRFAIAQAACEEHSIRARMS